MRIWKEFREDLIANECEGFSKAVLSPLISPAVLALLLYRISHKLHSNGGACRLISKLLWRANVFLTGCYISPQAKISGGMRLPHAVGVIIGEGVTIGRFVTLYQGVTLGRSRAADAAYPKIEDKVTIFAGAVVVGGIRVGHEAVIGANAFVNRDVPCKAVVVGIPAKSLVQNSIE